MSLTPQMKTLANQIFTGNREQLAQEMDQRRQEVIADAQRRNIMQSGIYAGNRLRVDEEHLQKLCEARVQSYLKVIEEAGLPLESSDISEIMAAVSELAERNAKTLADQMEQLARRDRLPVSGGWARGNLERVRDSTLATIRRNLAIQKGLQEVSKARPKQVEITNEVFVIMSFHPDLNEIYEKAILPAIVECGLTPYRVDKEEFEGTITEAILEKIRSSKMVVADLTFERPNCYYELGYAFGIGKPYVVTARSDHNPRRLSRKAQDPKVHFDLDSHKITYWNSDALGELKSQLCERIRKAST